MIKYFKRHGVFFTFLCALLIISIIIGILLYLCSSNESKKYVLDLLTDLKTNLLNTKINNILKHLLIILVIIILSFTVIGYFSGIIFLFYEGMSIGYTIAALIANYALKGLIFGILYNIIFRFIFLLLFIIILLKLFDLIKYLINYLFLKRTYLIKNNLKKLLLSVGILIMVIFINDIIIYFLTNFLLKMLINVL